MTRGSALGRVERERLARIRAALPEGALACRREVRAALATAAEALSTATHFGRAPVGDFAKAAALSFALYARALDDVAQADVVSLIAKYVDTPLERFVRLWHLAWSAYRDDGDGHAHVARAATHFLLACDALDEVLGAGASWAIAREIIVAQHRLEHGASSRVIDATPARAA